ncbi:MAG: hybrid sensor histidine kinase/response regulator [Planctomycetota bacterium]|nr:hybrid sensor histidine kinase/response regulator [Planctomycetota bacterium]
MNRHILLIDDTPSIHEDFKKILGADGAGDSGGLADARAALFGEEKSAPSSVDGYELESAFQGQEGLEMVIASLEAKTPYAIAFVDIRMPPGWDGVQTIKQLWKSDPELQIVICTAYSDYSWDQTIEELGMTDQLLILKKPFDSAEIRQLASALTSKWNAARRERDLIEELKAKEAEARAYASSLEMMNQALLTSKASSERASEVKTEFLVHLSTEVGKNLANILARFEESPDSDLECVLDSSRDLMVTLSRILDLTRIEGGEMQVEKSSCPIVASVKDAIECQRAQAAAKNIELVFHLPTSVPESFECDGEHLRQVLDQLIDNAIRHTDGGPVTVELRADPTMDWSRTELNLVVSDSGSGVPEDLMGRIFEPFVGRDGAGLGLALAHELMKAMGGQLTYERADNGGSRFVASMEVGNLSGVRMVAG